MVFLNAYELVIKLSLSHLTTHGLSQCICEQLINLIRIHLFCCAHGEKQIVTYDVLRDFFISIARDVEFHVLCEQTHFCLTPFF